MMAIGFFARLFPRQKSRREQELAYLHEAVSFYDLERRQHEIDSGLFPAR